MTEETEEIINPFATPTSVASTSIPDADLCQELQPFSVTRSAIKWVLICVVSGAPSFFFGFFLGNKPIFQGVAMLAGILTYASLYVLIESRESVRRRLHENRSLRLAVKIGYGTRIAISVIFPIATYLDLMCGTFSVWLTSSLFGIPFMGENSLFSGELKGTPILFMWFYVTTLVQGTIMNIVLGGYVLVVFPIVSICRAE